MLSTRGHGCGPVISALATRGGDANSRRTLHRRIRALFGISMQRMASARRAMPKALRLKFVAGED